MRGILAAKIFNCFSAFLNFRHSAAEPDRAGGFFVAEIFHATQKVLDIARTWRGRHSATSVYL
jgi:hypothetical protein